MSGFNKKNTDTVEAFYLKMLEDLRTLSFTGVTENMQQGSYDGNHAECFRASMDVPEKTARFK